MRRVLPPDADLLALIDAAGIWAAPGTTSWQDADGSFGTIARTGAYGNTVSRTRVAPDELPAFLAEIGRRYRRPPSFHVGPLETPGLAEALLAAGYVLARREGILVHDLDPARIPSPNGVEVLQALEAQAFLAENWLSGVVFGDPPMSREMAEAEAARARLPDPTHPRTFIVPDPTGKDPCLASAGMALYRSWAFLVSGQTHPEARGRGLYRALVAARLGVAADLGLDFAATEADAATSYPILSRWGFRCLGWKEIYRWPEADGAVRAQEPEG